MVKKIIALLCLVGTVLSLYNVYSNVEPLQKQAELVACGGSRCAGLVGRERTPIEVVFRFQVTPKQATTSQVNCQRKFILLGDYSCTKE